MRIWEKFPAIFRAVSNDYNDINLFGHHDLIHAARVGEVAYQIALSEWGDERIAQLAGIAGLCHNADHILQMRLNVGRGEVQDDQIRALVRSQIGTDVIEAEKFLVIEAVARHNMRNSTGDTPVLIALMDADRVVNLDVDLFPRSGQYYSDLPVVDFRYFLDDPEATYSNPKTVLRDIAYSLEWIDPNSLVCIRTTRGRQMAEARGRVFKVFFEALEHQLKEEGIMPYPFT